MSAYKLSAMAKRDVAEIRAYIADQNREAASRFGRRLRVVFRSIGTNPEIAKVHLEFSNLFGEPVRTRSVGSYVVLYRLTSATPEIFAVLHGARDIARVVESRFF